MSPNFWTTIILMAAITTFFGWAVGSPLLQIGGGAVCLFGIAMDLSGQRRGR